MWACLHDSATALHNGRADLLLLKLFHLALCFWYSWRRQKLSLLSSLGNWSLRSQLRRLIYFLTDAVNHLCGPTMAASVCGHFKNCSSNSSIAKNNLHRQISPLVVPCCTTCQEGIFFSWIKLSSNSLSRQKKTSNALWLPLMHFQYLAPHQ